MSLKISPRSELDSMTLGEEYAYELDTTDELGTKTVASHTYKIYNSAGTDVTTTFGGGSSITAGVITFGIKAYAAGVYTLKFIVTCNEVLPDGIAKYEFYVKLTVNIE